MPKFIYLLQATSESESGAAPSTEIIEAMTNYNTQLSEAEMLLGGDGFRDSSFGARLSFPTSEGAGKVEVTKGPFALGSLICGYWIVQAKSLEDAIEWAKKCPLRGGGGIEVRQIHGAEDFGDAFTDELREREKALFEKAQQRAKGL